MSYVDMSKTEGSRRGAASLGAFTGKASASDFVVSNQLGVKCPALVSPEGSSLRSLLPSFLPAVLIGYALTNFLRTPQSGSAEAKPAARTKKATWEGPAPPPGEDVKLVIVVRTDLGMSIGKTAAQVAHAAVAIVSKLRKSRQALLARWEECGQAKITLQCEGVSQLLELAQQAMAAGLPCEVIQDAGRTEVDPGTHTVLAIGPGAKSAIDAVTGKLRLLR